MKTVIPEEPDLFLEYLALSRQIDAAGEHEALPVGETLEISADPVYCVLKVRHITRRLRLQWRWYGPDRRLYKTSLPLEVNAKGVYLAHFIAWDELPPADFTARPGHWTVVVTVDDEMRWVQDFTLAPASS